MDALLRPNILGPLSGIVMIIAVVWIVFWYKARQRELEVHQQLRTREMEHERRLKELEIEKAKSELERARSERTPN